MESLPASCTVADGREGLKPWNQGRRTNQVNVVMLCKPPGQGMYIFAVRDMDKPDQVGTVDDGGGGGGEAVGLG